MVTLVIETGSGELLVRVTHLGALGRVTNCEPKAREELFGVGAGGRLPLPLSVTLVTPPLALWLISSAATKLPEDGGVKVMPKVRLPPAGTGFSLLSLLTLNAPAPAPVIPTLLMAKSASPVFRRVVLLAGLGIVISCEPKLKLVGLPLAIGAAASAGGANRYRSTK